MAEDQDCVRIFRCNPDNGEIKRLDIPEDVIKDFSLSSNGSMLYCIGQSASMPIVFMLIRWIMGIAPRLMICLKRN